MCLASAAQARACCSFLFLARSAPLEENGLAPRAGLPDLPETERDAASAAAVLQTRLTGGGKGLMVEASNVLLNGVETKLPRDMGGGLLAHAEAAVTNPWC